MHPFLDKEICYSISLSSSKIYIYRNFKITKSVITSSNCISYLIQMPIDRFQSIRVMIISTVIPSTVSGSKAKLRTVPTNTEIFLRGL